MGIYLFKLALFGTLLLFGAVAVFLGAVTGYAALQSGELTVVFGQGGRAVSSTVTRLIDPDAFWRSFALAAALPVLGGIAAVWYGRRGLGRL
jgi:hypothetical protein